jgi:hypothetical protein
MNDIVARFKIPNESWNGMYQSAPGRTRILNFQHGDMQATSKLPTFAQSSAVYGHDLCTLWILVHKYLFGEVDY